MTLTFEIKHRFFKISGHRSLTLNAPFIKKDSHSIIQTRRIQEFDRKIEHLLPLTEPIIEQCKELIN